MRKKIFSVIAAALASVFAFTGTAAFSGEEVHAAGSDYTYRADSSVKGHVWTKNSDNTWTMDLNGDTFPDVTLTSSINSEGEQEWTYTFNVEDDNQDYKVYEQMLKGDGTAYDGNRLASGYKGNGSDNKLAIDADPGDMDKATHSYTITNSKSHYLQYYGGLTVTKKVTGTQVNPDQEFSFTIQLGGNSTTLQNKIKGSQIFGDTPFMDGKAIVFLKAGGRKTINGIPAGLIYTVTETPVDGYTQSSKNGDSGTIEANKTQTAEFTNASSYVAPDPKKQKYVSFRLKKEVAGIPDDDDAEYKFHVVLSGLEAGKKYTYGTNGTYIADADRKADVAVSLKKDEDVVFSALPAGSAKYQIMEEAGNYTESYTVEDANNLGEIARAKGETQKANTVLSTAEEMADDDEDVTVTFTNTFAPEQTLTVQKFLSETINEKQASSNHDAGEYKSLSEDEKEKIDKDAQKKYEFTVNFYHLPENSVISSDIGQITPDEYGEAMKSFKLKADGTKVVFKNIPAGAQYRVTEAKNPNQPSFEIVTVNSRGKKIDGIVCAKSLEGSPGYDLYTGKHDSGNDEDETLETDESDTVIFTNTVLEYINLPVTGHKGIAEGIAIGSVCIASGMTFLLKRKKVSNLSDGEGEDAL